MNDQWQIALMGIALTIIGWGSASLSGLRRDIQAFVRREDCAADMQGHCTKIETLDKRLGKLENRVTAVETKIENERH